MITKYTTLEILNTDLGSQFASEALTAVLNAQGFVIGMDGRRCWRDNVFVERLWKSVKHEEVYLRAYESASQARESLWTAPTDSYNQRRPYSSLGRTTPDQFYFNTFKTTMTSATTINPPMIVQSHMPPIMPFIHWSPQVQATRS